MPLLRLDNVSLAYGHVPLLAHVDFQVEPGERVFSSVATVPARRHCCGSLPG
jgi:hypothetical protein